ncbi:VirB4 family type IV secretion system protein [Ammonifex thiophilus]|uniref:DUF87 domain-containing protein n=1 Tax=Ammonifex thiophilus TaxID=444093 RepID=A0A3D8P1D2_9THEO|nr:ATP-binding protein [Ammonifex thiophilus]RDV81227.1 DUF87 domain-containing protein [Ammonifex thiophilus]
MLFGRKKQRSREEITGERSGRDLSRLYAPDGIELFPRHIRTSGRYRRVYAVPVLPAALTPGFLERVFSLGDVEVSVHLFPVPAREASQKLTRKLTEVLSQLHLEVERQGKIGNLPVLETLKRQIEEVRQLVQLGQDRMYYCCLLFSVMAPSEEELERRASIFESETGGMGLKVQALEFWQDRALHHLMPLGVLPPFSSRWGYQNLLSGGAMCLSPFISSEIGHASGAFLGFIEHTYVPVFLDLFSKELLSPHMFIFGQTGSGKSVTASVLVGRNLALGRRAAVLDPEGEYRILTEKMGGLHVRLDPAYEAGFNVMDLEPEYDERTGDSYVDVPGKVREVVALFSSVLEFRGRKLTVEEETTMEEALRELYGERGITRDPESLYERGKALPDGSFAVGRVRKRMPTISELVARVEEKDPELASLLRPFTKGGTLGFLDCETDVSTSEAPIICFDLRATEKDATLRYYATQAVFLWLWERFVKACRQVEKIVLVDEAWVFMRHKNSVEFLLNAAKRGRKYKAGLLIATQSFRDFASDDGRNIIAQCSSSLLMRCKAEEARLLVDTLGLPEGVYRKLPSFQLKGQGVLKVGEESMAPVTVYVIPWEWELLEKQPDDMF